MRCRLLLHLAPSSSKGWKPMMPADPPYTCRECGRIVTLQDFPMERLEDADRFSEDWRALLDHVCHECSRQIDALVEKVARERG